MSLRFQSGFSELISSQNVRRIAFSSLGVVGLYYFLFRKPAYLPSKGKVVIITGCDTPLGFGTAIARRLRQLGYAVFAGCLDAKKTGESGIYGEFKDDPLFNLIQLDVTNQAQIDNAAEEVDSWLKRNPEFRMFGIVNNAGIGSFAPMEWLRMETFTKIFDVNCFGGVRVTKAFLPLIRRGGDGGRIVFMSSIAGEVPSPLEMPYCASKAAVNAIVECLSIEVSKFGIKVSAICPDFYRTNILTEPEKSIQALEKEIAGLPNEVFEAYHGQARVEKMKKAVVDVPNIAKIDLSPVVNCTVDALASPCPKRRYYPIELVNFVVAKFIYYAAPSIIDLLMDQMMNA